MKIEKEEVVTVTVVFGLDEFRELLGLIDSIEVPDTFNTVKTLIRKGKEMLIAEALGNLGMAGFNTERGHHETD